MLALKLIGTIDYSFLRKVYPPAETQARRLNLPSAAEEWNPWHRWHATSHENDVLVRGVHCVPAAVNEEEDG
jgi:hypothetical protein